MLTFLDQMEIVLRLIGYTKSEIETMNEWEPIRKVMAGKMLLQSMVESTIKSIVSELTQSKSGNMNMNSNIIPFNNMGNLEL